MNPASQPLPVFQQRDTSVAPLAPEIVRQAATYLVQLQSFPDDSATLDACRRWREAHPQHETAWSQVCALIALPGASEGMHGPSARSAIEHLASRRHRRKFLTLGLTVVGAGAVSWSFDRASPMRAILADYRSATGERRQIVLDDGTSLMLNTNTVIDVKEVGGQRRIVLWSGEIMVTSSKQPERRALRVDTRYGTVTPIGTRFSVRDTGDGHAHVALFEGQLNVQSRDGSAIILDPGMSVNLGQSTISDPEALGLSAGLWTRGVLLAERMPLGEFLAELARYRRGIVRCDPSIAHRPISGTFPLDRSDEALSLVGRVMGLKITYITRYWLMVSPA